MNRARAKNPFRALVDLAVKEAGGGAPLSRTIGAGRGDKVTPLPVTTTGQNQSGALTWTALTDVDFTESEGAFTE